MRVTEAQEALEQLEKEMQAYHHAMGVLSQDAATCAPSASFQARGETMGVLSGVLYRLLIQPSTEEILQTLRENEEQLSPALRRRTELLWKEYQETTCLPMEEVMAFTKLQNDSQAVWQSAREADDFPAFAPYLEKLVATQVRFAGYKDQAKDPYDVALDMYEEGTTQAMLDPFFQALRDRLVPLLHAVGEKPAPRTDFLCRTYPVAQQRLFSQKLMDRLGLDRTRCVLGESAHPFTNGFNRWDVRITTHYMEHQVASSMYSVIHEGGHALYELGMGEALQGTCLAGGASMAMHESQSRLYENIIGRSQAFCHALYPLLRESFPQQMADVTEAELYRSVNVAQPSLIRTEADELTYPMHIMVRYELEKQLFAGTLSVRELPEAWGEMYQKYLGVHVPNDREGVLQDIHWSDGSFGYFPSYSLGDAYGAQLLAAMEKDVDVWGAAASGKLAPVTAWLGEKIHQQGRLLPPRVLLRKACGGDFDPGYYTRYLTEKYTKLYAL